MFRIGDRVQHLLNKNEGKVTGINMFRNPTTRKTYTTINVRFDHEHATKEYEPKLFVKITR